MTERPVELLANVPLFSELSAGELERVARVAVPRSYPKGVRVFHEGDTSDACYVVAEGDLRVTREHPDGRAISLATLGPRDIFGELAMLDGGTRSASIETLSECELLALPATDMRRVIADHGEIAAKLLRPSPGACARPTSALRGSPSKRCPAVLPAFSCSWSPRRRCRTGATESR